MSTPSSESGVRAVLKDAARDQVKDWLLRIFAINAAMLHGGGVLLLHRIRDVPAHVSWVSGVVGIAMLFWVVGVLTTGRVFSLFGRGKSRFRIDWLPALMIWPIGLSLWACLSLGLASMQSNQHLANGMALPVMMTVAAMLPLVLGLLPAWPEPSKRWFLSLDVVYILTTMIAAALLFSAVNQTLQAAPSSLHGPAAQFQHADGPDGVLDDDDDDDECAITDSAIPSARQVTASGATASAMAKSVGNTSGFRRGCASAQTTAEAVGVRDTTAGFAHHGVSTFRLGSQENPVIASAKTIDEFFSMPSLGLLLLGGLVLITGRWFASRGRPDGGDSGGGEVDRPDGLIRGDWLLERATKLLRSPGDSPSAVPAAPVQPSAVEVAAASVAAAAQPSPDIQPIAGSLSGHPHPAQFRYESEGNPYAPKHSW